MQLAKVLGTATATQKHPSLHGWRLLVVQTLMADGRTADGEPLLAVDRLGAGRGEIVALTSDAKLVTEQMQTEQTPVRWSVLGIKD